MSTINITTTFGNEVGEVIVHDMNGGSKRFISADKAKAPSIESLARSIFSTDQRIIEFVSRVSDHVVGNSGREYDLERYKVALEKAWNRDELGARTEAAQRAGEILEILEAGE